MKILAIDSTTKSLSLGIYNDGKIYEYNVEIGRRLSALLIVIIKRTLEALDLKVGDLDYFACGLGPGSFTGMRIGLSTMKGLSWSQRKPLIGISTLDILAMNAKVFTEKVIIPAIDAKRSLIYSCFYKNTLGIPKKTSPYMLISKEELLKKMEKQPSVLLGDALNLYKDELSKNASGTIFLDKDDWYPKAHNILQLTLDRIKNKKTSDIAKIHPIYLYAKECQVKYAHK